MEEYIELTRIMLFGIRKEHDFVSEILPFCFGDKLIFDEVEGNQIFYFASCHENEEIIDILKNKLQDKVDFIFVDDFIPTSMAHMLEPNRKEIRIGEKITLKGSSDTSLETVDDVLDKIIESGEDSLTPAERKILEQHAGR